MAKEEMSAGPDDAAINAVSDFWASNPELESAAAQEVPDAPIGAAPRENRALAQEYADQQLELEQEGLLEPGDADGIPSDEKPAPKDEKPQATGQPVTPPKGEEKPVESGLDPVLRSIAEDSGWKPEQIDRLYAADPELAEQTFSQLADSFVNLSRQFLAPAPGTTPAAPTNTQPAQVPAQSPSQLPAEISDDALKAFAAENGEQAANLLKTIRDHFSARTGALEQRVQKAEQVTKSAEDKVIAQEASATVADLSTKFPTLYGKGDNHRLWTVEQYEKRVELATLADQIRSGAINQGRTISVKDAIKRAHYIVSRDSVKTEARTELAATIKQRSRNATARPTQRTNPRSAGQSRSNDAAINAAAEKMAEIGFNEG